MPEQYDVIVVGGGAAGCAASVAAAQCGARVLVLEKNKTLGGNGVFPMGIYAVDSLVQRRELILTTAEEAFLACMDYSHWNLNAKAVRALIEKSGSTIGWLEDMGVVFSGVIHHLPNQSPEVFHVAEGSICTGRTVMNALCTEMERLDVQVLTEAMARELVCQDGTVCGVRAACCDETLEFPAHSVIVVLIYT